MAYIGAIALAWTEVEQKLELLVSTALGDFRIQAGGAVAGNPSRVGLIAIRKAETIRARLALIDAYFEVLFDTAPTLLAEWADIATMLRKRSRERNTVVHAMWRYADDKPDALIRDDPKVTELWTLADFEAVLNRIDEADRLILGFHHQVATAVALGVARKVS